MHLNSIIKNNHGKQTKEIKDYIENNKCLKKYPRFDRYYFNQNGMCEKNEPKYEEVNQLSKLSLND